MKMAKKQTSKSVLEAALAILARREHSTLELTRKLRTKQYAPAEIADVITRLTGKNLLNDARYAEVRARTRAQGSKWGANRIRQELAQTGVEKSLATTTLNQLSEDHDWLATAHKLLSRKFPQPLPSAATADPSLGRMELMKELQKQKAKRISFLTRRGFTMEQALKALNLTELDESFP